MKTLRLDTTELGLDFNAALKLATAFSSWVKKPCY
jgi:hypothetical protein